MTVSVVTVPERRTRPGLMPSLINPDWCAGSPDVEGLFAVVVIDGVEYHVSKMTGETEWTADSAFRPGSSCPIFQNGFGARYCRTRVLPAEAAAVLDNEISTNDFCAEMADPS